MTTFHFMLIGVTQIDPSKNYPLPQYALPDLAHTGPAWVFAIPNNHNDSIPHRQDYIFNNVARRLRQLRHANNYENVLGDSEQVRTSRGIIRRQMLRPRLLHPRDFVNGDQENVQPELVSADWTNGHDELVDYDNAVLENENATNHFASNHRSQDSPINILPTGDTLC